MAKKKATAQQAPLQDESAAKENIATPVVELLRMYIKDLSLQIPEGAHAFQLEWKPELNIEVNTQGKSVSEPNHYEVAVRLKVTNTCGGKVAFIAEAIQAGLFRIEHLDELGLKQAFGVVCPNILYPFLRETIGDTVLRAGFPQLNLAAMNFELMASQAGAAGQTIQ